MKRPSSPHRPAALALCLVALLAAGGCTRFRYAVAHPTAAAAERAAREEAYARSHGQPAAPPPAALPPAALPPAAPPPAALPPAPPQPAPRAVEPAAPAPSAAPPAPSGPSAAERHRAEKAARKAEQDEARARSRQERIDRRAEKSRPAPAAPITAAPREAVPIAPAPAQAPAAQAYVAPLAPPPAESFANTATVIFTNTPGTHCGACETVKLSVTPSGQVLIERGHWTGSNRDWRYRKSVTHVPVARAAAFARQLAAYRPSGDRALANDATCSGPATLDDGLVIEWIEAGHHDRATIAFACPAQSNGAIARALREAPALLGLRQLGFPWETGQ